MEKRPEPAILRLYISKKRKTRIFSEWQASAITQEIAILGSGSDERRRSELIRSGRTLDDQVEEMKKHGFTLSRWAINLQLAPSRQNTKDGRWHVTTVPIRLYRTFKHKRTNNSDQWFPAKSREQTEQFAFLFGPVLTMFIGQNDEAHVPIGINAANKQAQLLTSVKCKVQLLGHDFVITTKYKLTPAVMGLRELKDAPLTDRRAVKYAGPTLIQIKPLKHTPSNAAVQIEALDEMLKPEELRKLEYGSTKPIWILTLDGHDGPRFPTRGNNLVSIFK